MSLIQTNLSIKDYKGKFYHKVSSHQDYSKFFTLYFLADQFAFCFHSWKARGKYKRLVLKHNLWWILQWDLQCSNVHKYRYHSHDICPTRSNDGVDKTNSMVIVCKLPPSGYRSVTPSRSVAARPTLVWSSFTSACVKVLSMCLYVMR